jgi:hypothetical protein
MYHKIGVRALATGLATVLFLTLAETSAFADYTVRICIGEDQANGCPVSKDAMFSCGTSYDEAASLVCTITVSGQKKVKPYRAIPQGTHEGGRCGYGWALVTCIGNDE